MSTHRIELLARIANSANRFYASLVQTGGYQRIASVLTVGFWLIVLAFVLWLWGAIDLTSGVSSGSGP